MSQKSHLKTRPKLMAYSLKTLGAAIVSAALFTNAYGAGLGKLTVLSSLGQPLHAEIELTAVSKEESGSLTVKLASADAFRQANVEFNPALYTLRFAIEQRGGRQFIRVTSTQPINEPFVDMLLEVGGTNSRLVREYTFLLDPVDLRKSQPVQVATPGASASSPARAPQPIAQPQAEPADKPIVAAKPPQRSGAKRATAVQPPAEAKNTASSDGYQVEKGDTLTKIATRLKPEGVSLDQMLVALQRANSSAFIGNNINRLRAGQILSVPDADTARGINNAEARGVVMAQAADFNGYRNKLASQVAGAAPQKSEEARNSATGKITTKVEEQPTAANEAKDKLKLSKSGAAATTAEKGLGISAGAEDKIANEKALAEANARVKELEKNVNDLQKLLEIKNKDLAEKQQQVEVAKAGVNPGVANPGAANPVVTPATSPPIVTPPPALPAVPAPAAGPADSPTPVAAQTTDNKPAPAQPAKPAATPTKMKPVAPSAPPAPAGFIDDLLGNPLLLSVLAAVLLALGALGIYTARRKQRAEFHDSNILGDSNLKANSLFGSTGGQSVDTGNSVFNSNFAPSASQLDTNEVDPVAEADVYIAYGRDAQAEEILKEALRTQPDRNTVRVKLLEIYASRKDLRAFEMLASELYSMTKGNGEDWMQAANMGIAIDSKNPLYAGGKPIESAGPKAAVFVPTQPLDELDLDALLNTTQTSIASSENFKAGDAAPSASGATAGAARITPPPAPLPKLDTKDLGEIGIPASQPLKPAELVKPPSVPSSPAGLDFDFDLAGLGIKEVPLPMVPPVSPPEPQSAPNDISFDFNDESNTGKGSQKADTGTSVPTSEDSPADFELLNMHLASVSPPAAAPHESTPAPGALDFDLSGISLDLNPVDTKSGVTTSSDAKPAGLYDTQAAGGGSQANVAEMATKLDLALAYQEIGDKEGARELLDEVVKGGTTEQTEKAKSMLQKFG